MKDEVTEEIGLMISELLENLEGRVTRSGRKLPKLDAWTTANGEVGLYVGGERYTIFVVKGNI